MAKNVSKNLQRKGGTFGTKGKNWVDIMLLQIEIDPLGMPYLVYCGGVDPTPTMVC